jgi:hypothetical protein
VNALNFLDMLLNPQQAPRIYLPFLKTMNREDTHDIEQLYSVFGALSVDCLALELSYTEADEAKMITRIATAWQEQKPAFLRLVAHIRSPAPVHQKPKSYAG